MSIRTDGTGWNWNVRDDSRGILVIENVVAPDKFQIEFSDDGPPLYIDAPLRYIFRATIDGTDLWSPWFFPNAFPHLVVRPNFRNGVNLGFRVQRAPGVTADVRIIN